ncbi:hypothetical protein AMJ80_09095 [bacterium SM23_31]|nr:MAG: hypothetical protein AMJ80_09095 [bacterium SM23_31]
MVYLGSKRRLAKHFLSIILNERRPLSWNQDQVYVEPFAGGCNMIEFVSGPRIANDINFYLIELFRAVQAGWIPPASVAEEQYYHIRANPHLYPPKLVGFAGIACAYNGIWFRTYAKNNRQDNYANQGRKALLIQRPRLRGVRFTNCHYADLKIPPASLVYCDPPYQDSAGYDYNNCQFDHEKHWQWVRDLEAHGHTVFVSEFKAPPDFECVKEVFLESSTKRCRDRVERLFRLKKRHT